MEAVGDGEPASVAAVTKETGEYYFQLSVSHFEKPSGCIVRKIYGHALSQG